MVEVKYSSAYIYFQPKEALEGAKERHKKLVCGHFVFLVRNNCFVEADIRPYRLPEPLWELKETKQHIIEPISAQVEQDFNGTEDLLNQINKIIFKQKDYATLYYEKKKENFDLSILDVNDYHETLEVLHRFKQHHRGLEQSSSGLEDLSDEDLADLEIKRSELNLFPRLSKLVFPTEKNNCFYIQTNSLREAFEKVLDIYEHHETVLALRYEVDRF